MIFVTWRYPVYGDGYHEDTFEEQTCVFDSVTDIKNFLLEHRAHVIKEMWEFEEKKQVIKCKDCAYFSEEIKEGIGYCHRNNEYTSPGNFCASAEKVKEKKECEKD